LGLSSCDPVTVERLIEAGRMPHFAQIRREGAWGRLLAGEPLVASSIWTTLATGRQPETHGVLSPSMPRPDGGGVIQVGRAAWRAPSVWQAAAAGDRRTLTIGWPATWPATAWTGIHVDIRFATPTGPDFGSWAMPSGCVAPLPLRERLRMLRVHPTDVTGLMLAPLVPRLTEVDQYRDPRLTQLAVILATTTTLHAAATALIETEAWDLACVHYPLLD
jgi:hypothetical protein